jgi:Predicted integral membrane protein
MKGFFSLDNPVMRFITKVGYLWYLDVLFVVTSLPVFTIGVSITALNYACTKLIDDEGTVTGNYFKSWKENFKQGTGLGLLYLAFGALLALALVFYNRMDQSDIKIMWAVVIAIGIFYFISLCWVFAIQSKFVHTVQDTIHYSFVIAFQNLPETFLIMITIAAVVFFSCTQPFIVLFLVLNFGIGWCFYLFAYFYAKVFDRYINKDQHRKASKEAEPILK